MSEDDPEELADRLEQETEELERHSERLKEQAQEVRRDWERKRADESVPGANPPPDRDQQG